MRLALRPNHAITWHLNGKQLEFPPDATSFALPHLDRGTYALAATITDQQTGESQTSNTVTFYVRQPSALVAAAQIDLFPISRVLRCPLSSS